MDSIALRLQDDKENGMENFFIKSTFFTYNLNYYSNKVSSRKGDARLRGHDNADKARFCSKTNRCTVILEQCDGTRGHDNTEFSPEGNELNT